MEYSIRHSGVLRMKYTTGSLSFLAVEGRRKPTEIPVYSSLKHVS